MPFRSQRSRRAVLVSGIALIASCASAGQRDMEPAAASDRPARRAILVSFDSFSEARAYETLDTAAIPEIMALFRESACADHAVPHFPSLTAPGHAALWTGAYGNVNGIAGNVQPQLPQDRHTIMETASGYHFDALRAEPIWITAGSTGMNVVALHPTQAPAAPGYPSVRGERDDTLRALRERAERVLEMRNVRVLNGYGPQLANDTVLTAAVAPPRQAAEWTNLDRLGRSVPPREISWKLGEDSLFALLHGPDRYDRVLVSASRNAAEGVVVVVAEVERARPRGRELARHFSAPLRVRTGPRSYFVYARLFELAPDGSQFLLFIPRVSIVAANRADVEEEHADAVQGWVGNGANRLYERGRLGPTLHDGGDGTAELRYLETNELLTRQFMRGVEWGWNTLGATLLVDYFPLGDEIDHQWLGAIDSTTPVYRADVGVPLADMRQRAWEMLDLRLGHLRSLVARNANAALFVSGDHGMRTSWRRFRPNVVLREAGLLALDTADRIDPARSRVVSPSGHYLMLNRTAWRDGVVAPGEEAEVLAAAERALLAARSPEGTAIVTRIFRPSPSDSLGLGGPVGGEIYFELARGYHFHDSPRGAVSEDVEPTSGHAYPSISPDMFTVFCAYGPSFTARRIPGVRTIVAAPTVSEWLGIPAPPQAQAGSVLSPLLGRSAAQSR